MFLELKNIEFAFHDRLDKKILDDISVSNDKGKVLAIVGVSGAGKSTLLRLIAGILPRTKDKLSGVISIDDVPLSQYLQNHKVAFMFQEPALLPNLTVRENIELALKIDKSDPSAEEIINLVGLKSYEHYLPNKLSGGMKTRVSLARSFVGNPQVLLLDEPFSALDIAWKNILYHELKQLIKISNTSVVLVTHDIREALELGDTVLCLGLCGKVILENTETKNVGLYSLIKDIIISDHKLIKEHEKKFEI